MTSSNGNIFRVTGPLCGEFTGPGEFLAQRPVTRSFDIFFDLRLNKRLSKQSWGWWFETPSWSLWRHCNGTALNGVITGPGKSLLLDSTTPLPGPIWIAHWWGRMALTWGQFHGKRSIYQFLWSIVTPYGVVKHRKTQLVQLMVERHNMWTNANILSTSRTRKKLKWNLNLNKIISLNKYFWNCRLQTFGHLAISIKYPCYQKTVLFENVVIHDTWHSRWPHMMKLPSKVQSIFFKIAVKKWYERLLDVCH